MNNQHLNFPLLARAHSSGFQLYKYGQERGFQDHREFNPFSQEKMPYVSSDDGQQVL